MRWFIRWSEPKVNRSARWLVRFNEEFPNKTTGLALFFFCVSCRSRRPYRQRVILSRRTRSPRWWMRHRRHCPMNNLPIVDNGAVWGEGLMWTASVYCGHDEISMKKEEFRSCRCRCCCCRCCCCCFLMETLRSWDEQYATELETFQDCGDVGEIWFGRRVLDTMVRWIDGRCADHRDATAVLDLGCGNGVLLLELVRRLFSLSRIDALEYSY